MVGWLMLISRTNCNQFVIWICETHFNIYSAIEWLEVIMSLFFYFFSVCCVCVCLYHWLRLQMNKWLALAWQYNYIQVSVFMISYHFYPPTRSCSTWNLLKLNAINIKFCFFQFGIEITCLGLSHSRWEGGRVMLVDVR